MKLVALCGLHGAGKDTVADALPARKLAFADVLYREVAEAFFVAVEELKCRETKEVPTDALKLRNCSSSGFACFLDDCGWPFELMHSPRSPRQILQWWGDYRRAQDPEYFVKAVQIEVQVSEWDCDDVVITDCRFPNEAAMVRQLGGKIWQVVRPGHNPPCSGHASETTGDEFAPDVVIRNAGSIEDLRATALKEWNR